MRRQAGVVLPLFAIRTETDWGIGQISDLPRCAEWISRVGHRLLQVLPTHELSPGETSPYGALTAFGLDPIYVDPRAIADLDEEAVESTLGDEGRRARDGARASVRVDYSTVRALKARVLRAAFDRFYEREWIAGTPRAKALRSYMDAEKAWLDDLALYNVLRESHGGWGWSTWPEDEQIRSPAALRRVREEHPRRLLEVAYVQWTLDDQWQRARAEMRSLGVELMGDLPFVVGIESADVWAHAAQFQMKLSLGAPPDEFSAGGQDWGLPPYDWVAMDSDELGWIRARARRAARLYDRLRLDHVVGYFRQWVRPKQAADSNGRFDPQGTEAQIARGTRVLRAMLEEITSDSHGVDPPRAIAEDLGVVPPFVREALRRLGMPGYRVIPWERDEKGYRDPRSFPEDSVASWSTHDTAPLDAWWDELRDEDRAELGNRAGVRPETDPEQRSLLLLADLYQSRSKLALVLAQELLGARDRINTPGTVGVENWSWRLPSAVEDLDDDEHLRHRFAAIRDLVRQAGR
ncbi:MAG TPA: 4-alpha-glucanotransferase [Polyangiaceae bacterium]|nr:4-alpha-glucanotransferase [Polyangiaceae bacterium]